MCTLPAEDAPCAALAGLEQTMLILKVVCKHKWAYSILEPSTLLWILLPFYTKAVLTVMNACGPLDGTLEALASVLLSKNVAAQHDQHAAVM